MTSDLLLAFSKSPELESREISQAAERMETSIHLLKEKVCQKQKRSVHPTGKYNIQTLAELTSVVPFTLKIFLLPFLYSTKAVVQVISTY